MTSKKQYFDPTTGWLIWASIIAAFFAGFCVRGAVTAYFGGTATSCNAATYTATNVVTPQPAASANTADPIIEVVRYPYEKRDAQTVIPFKAVMWSLQQLENGPPSNPWCVKLCFYIDAKEQLRREGYTNIPPYKTCVASEKWVTLLTQAYMRRHISSSMIQPLNVKNIAKMFRAGPGSMHSRKVTQLILDARVYADRCNNLTNRYIADHTRR